jgi:glycosyltransferase involved in cell wall biosynthesis
LYNAKLIWLTEFYFNHRRFLGGRKYYLGLNFLIKPIAAILRRYFYKNVDKIILSDISEKQYISTTSNKLVSIGWCNNLPIDFNKNPIKLNLKLNQAIFAGSLTSITINENFIKSVSYLLDNNIIEKILIIGDGPKKYIIDQLIDQYSIDKIEYLGQMNRIDVLDLIKKSKIALNTTYEGGWGFIGECFAVGTLLLFTRNHYRFKTSIDSFHLKLNDENLIQLKNIISNENVYSEMQSNMIERYQNNHTSSSIAKKYRQIFTNLLK